MRALQKLGMMGTGAVLISTLWSISTVWDGREAGVAKANTLLEELGSLSLGDDVLDDGSLYDQYTFSGSSGQYATIFLESDDFDPYLILLDPDGERISENDDTNRSDRNSRLVVTLPSTGVYTAVANSYESGKSGDYAIKIEVGDTPTSLAEILAAATVPNGSAACQSAIVSAIGEIKTDREITVLVSGLPLEQLYRSVPTARPKGIEVALSGSSALSVMFSPQFLDRISGEVITACDSVGAVTFGSDASEFERTFGVVARTNRRARGQRSGLPTVNEFTCADSESARSQQEQDLPDWGERVCL
ncbi:MAG: PPC domain-containing protein [Cyanobacteria bacterium J06623_4]